jgi:Ca-activated chloride channel family protein
MTKRDLEAVNIEHYKKGDELYKQKKYRDALSEFKLALKAMPDDHESFWAIADCYSELGRPEDAEKYYRLTLDNCPSKKKSDVLYNIGNALFDQTKYKDALEVYDSISKRSKVHAKARKNIRVAKSKIERY